MLETLLRSGKSCFFLLFFFFCFFFFFLFFFFLNCAPKVDPFCRHLNFGFKDYSSGPEYCDNT